MYKRENPNPINYDVCGSFEPRVADTNVNISCIIYKLIHAQHQTLSKQGDYPYFYRTRTTHHF